MLRDIGPAGFEFHGAAGNKALYVVQGKADAYVSPFYLMRWDICAPEALLKSRLGIATGLQREQILYNPMEKKEPIKGIVFARHYNVHETCMKRLAKFIAKRSLR